MQILVIAATKAEIEQLVEIPGYLDIEITGVGVPATIFHLQKRLKQIDYDLVIQVGIAGTFGNKFRVGEVAVVKQDTFADIGMEESGVFTSIFETGFAEKNEFPFSGGWLVNDHPIIDRLQLPLATGATINRVSDSQLQKQQFIKSFAPDIETMEGAALHYVCLLEKLPFIQIRAISNEVGIRDKGKWKMNEAIGSLNEAVKKLVLR
jgi:futalosine hydrolase